jgi:hypothetical protein
VVEGAVRQHAQAVEDLCGIARSRGAGWRVWIGRSRMVVDGDIHKLVYDTALVPPGASDAPGEGTLLGPWE